MSLTLEGLNPNLGTPINRVNPPPSTTSDSTMLPCFFWSQANGQLALGEEDGVAGSNALQLADVCELNMAPQRCGKL